MPMLSIFREKTESSWLRSSLRSIDSAKEPICGVSRFTYVCFFWILPREMRMAVDP